jgi:UDP-N-acetylglucosamine:LPS N-acetylglucosamine transferase
LSDYWFVITPPLAARVTQPPPNVLVLPSQPTDYVSLLAACDVVVTKPGYGIVADCLANRIPVLYTSRGPFREYDVLVQALHAYGRAHYVPREDLLAGRLADHLAALEATPNTWADVPLHGAEAIAERVLQRIGEPASQP